VVKTGLAQDFLVAQALQRYVFAVCAFIIGGIHLSYGASVLRGAKLRTYDVTGFHPRAQLRSCLCLTLCCGVYLSVLAADNLKHYRGKPFHDSNMNLAYSEFPPKLKKAEGRQPQSVNSAVF